jgi:hypothetical protein
MAKGASPAPAATCTRAARCEPRCCFAASPKLGCVWRRC